MASVTVAWSRNEWSALVSVSRVAVLISRSSSSQQAWWVAVASGQTPTGDVPVWGWGDVLGWGPWPVALWRGRLRRSWWSIQSRRRVAVDSRGSDWCGLSVLRLWLDERPDWPGAQTTPALLLNRRGTRLTTRGASTIFRTIATTAGLEDTITAHIGRRTFATTLVRGGTDLVTVAEMLGHARLDTVRAYTRPTADDRAKALNLLPTDR